ncbi:hypothetical protein O3663_09015 [Rothia mucilaginosa]|uniref:hypothetical protein n=1 Tax=Rothia mucilaginosa TaxID=43675 RepID=UPI00352BE5D1
MAARTTASTTSGGSPLRAASLGGTRRDLGLDLARAYAVLTLLIAFGYWLQLIPVSWRFWVPQLVTPAEPLFAAILGAAAWHYARAASFPQLFAGTIVRFLALLVLGIAVVQGAAYVPLPGVTTPAQGFAYSLPFDMLIHLAILTLLTLAVVYLPLWVLAVLAIAASPYLSWTHDILLEAAARADAWSAGAFPFLKANGLNLTASAQLLWVMCLGILLVRLYTSLGAKIAVPVVLAVLALSVYRVFNPYTGLGVLDTPHVQLTLSLAATLYFWAECARLLSAQAGALTPVARLGQMSLSASIVLSSLIIYAGPTIKAFTVGEHYVATGGWGTAVYWTAFLILGIVIAVGFCALWARMARSLAGRGPLEAILALISGRG